MTMSMPIKSGDYDDDDDDDDNNNKYFYAAHLPPKVGAQGALQ